MKLNFPRSSVISGPSLLIACQLLVACTATHQFADLRIVADDSKSSRKLVSSLDKSQTVEGRSCRRFILAIPINGQESINAAVSNAIASTPEAEGLQDAIVKHTSLYTVFYNHECYTVSGKPIYFTKKK